MERQRYDVGVFPGGRPSRVPQNTPLFSKRLGARGKGNLFSRGKEVSLPPEPPTLIGNRAFGKSGVFRNRDGIFKAAFSAGASG